MGKILIVDSMGKAVEKDVQDTVFEILKAALAPGIKEAENPQLMNIINGITTNKRLSQKYSKDMSFFRSVHTDDTEALTVVFSYTPKSTDCVAQIQIWSSSLDGVTPVFFGIFTIESPNVTQLEIKEMEPVEKWLPGLKTQ